MRSTSMCAVTLHVTGCLCCANASEFRMQLKRNLLESGFQHALATLHGRNAARVCQSYETKWIDVPVAKKSAYDRNCKSNQNNGEPYL